MEHESDARFKAGRAFSVPVEVLFQSWTDPAQLKQWWKPMGNQLVEATNDLREGGQVAYRFQANGRDTLEITGNYLEVQPAKKLVYSWNWNIRHPGLSSSEYKLTLYFRPAGHGSSIEVHQENTQDREPVIPHHHGWDKALEDLAGFLKSGGFVGEQAAGTPADHEGKPDYGSQNPAGV
ncbi:MAG TPA: SRPBCC family protein [Sphingobacteriaceae bacterium]